MLALLFSVGFGVVGVAVFVGGEAFFGNFKGLGLGGGSEIVG